ncbi:hypothetical protein MKW92_033707 [Papaver armeniacum]|nr:hypothetical protein MKW92_033707 [Papaver armeniacum]
MGGDLELKRYLLLIYYQERESLRYRLLGSPGDVCSWGHEYNIRREFSKIQDVPTKDLMELTQQIVAFNMTHNVEDLDLLVDHVDAANYKRTCMYLTALAVQLPTPDDQLVLDMAYSIYLQFSAYVKQLFTICNDIQHKKQFCYILARHGVHFVLDENMEIMNNMKLSEGYLNLARDIDVMEANAGASVDSARQNLAATFVNAFVNAGFGQDKVDDSFRRSSGGTTGSWLFKNKEHGRLEKASQRYDFVMGCVGIVNSSVKHECDPIMALLSDYVNKEDSTNEQIYQQLSPTLGDSSAPLDVIAFTAISLGLVLYIILALMDRSEAELGRKQESVEATSEVSKTFHEKIRKYCDMTLLSCETHLGPAVIGIAMIAMAEELGLDMAIRSLEHMLQYGEQSTRRAVALALGLFCISNPKVNVMDTLSRLSHDADSEVAMAAIISLGLIGAGTNNATPASYFAYGLLKVSYIWGRVYSHFRLTMLSGSCSPRRRFAGLIIMLHTCIDMKTFILGKYHYVLYFLDLAMKPRILMTSDQNQKPSVPVRVGQAVDVTHSTPVLLAAGDRAELATDKYIPLSPILEGFVILIENPDYHDDMQLE